MASHIGIYLSAYLRGLTDERRDCLKASDITPPPRQTVQHHSTTINTTIIKTKSTQNTTFVVSFNVKGRRGAKAPPLSKSL